VLSPVIQIQARLATRSRKRLWNPVRSRQQLTLVLLGHGLVRIAGAASGVSVGLYIANLSNHGVQVGAALVGTLSAVSYAAELIGVFPLGIAADYVSRRGLVTGGALLGALATQLFGMSGHIPIFFLSRALEGLAAAAIAPALLSYLADVTEGDLPWRARVMSYFELSLLGGLGAGGLFAAHWWDRLQSATFSMVAVIYLAASVCLVIGAGGGRRRSVAGRHRLGAVIRDPSIRHIAPLMLCVSATVGLWLGPALPYLLTHRSGGHQYIPGLYADEPSDVGWLLLGYSMVFAAGLIGWSRFLPRISAHRAMHVALLAMLAVCIGIGILNYSSGYSPLVRWTISACTAALIMVESGFTPAALVWLTAALGPHAGRGTAMGAYSTMLGVGSILGALLAAALAPRFAVDGLLVATFAIALLGLRFLRGLRPGSTGFPEKLDAETAV
jgi:MFS family permease